MKHKVSKSASIESELTSNELAEAKKLWIINEQYELESDNKLLVSLSRSLGIFKDVNGIYRLRGRLQESELDIDAKYPIYLDRKSHLTELIIHDCHEKVKHSKVRDTLNELRSMY